VRVNGERARAATRVGPGDELHVVRRQLHYELTVLGVPLRRGSAAVARACYSESAESISRREQLSADLRRDRLQLPMTRGKPDKRTRRKLLDRKSQP
jgi:ribosome-associated heat shock protein Hsp15